MTPRSAPRSANRPGPASKIRKNGVFCCRIDKPGLWQIGNEPRLISGKYPVTYGPPAVFRDDDLLVPDFTAPEGARVLAQPLAGGPDRVIGYAPGAFNGAGGSAAQSKFAVNPKTGDVIYVAALEGDTNIEFLTLTRN